MAETAASASPNFPPHDDPQSRILELEREVAQWKNAHAVAMSEREYWFKKWNELYEQHRKK
jgi:hypothetical protein